MKYNLYLVTLILISDLLITSCGQKGLSEDDSKIITELGFDLKLMSDLRSLTDSTFNKTTGNPDGEINFRDSLNFVEFSNKNLVGLTFNENAEKALMIVNKLRNLFKQKGYMIYISEYNFGYSPEKVTILKTDDKYDILRFEGTNGINYDIYIEELISKLKEWDKAYGIEFYAAGFDFLEADYLTLPADLGKHADELYEFCPDIVDQGVGTIEALKETIEVTQQLYLWWD